MTPRHFVPDGPSSPTPPAPSTLMALDQIRIGSEEFIVTTDLEGHLRRHPANERRAMGHVVHANLNANELAGPVREIHSADLWLLALHGLSPRGPVPGLNDPVEVTGTLFGPFPSEAPQMTHGRLSTTRGDLLDGLVIGSWSPFRLSEAGRTVSHLMLAGDSEQETKAGRGLVLAYPISPAMLSLDTAANDAMVLELLYELLSALRTDQQAEGVGSLPVLPVPDREALKATLEARGFTIRGDAATRPRRGLLGSLFAEKIVIPPAATAPDLLALARAALAELPGWPVPRVQALHAYLGLKEATWTPDRPAGLWPVTGDHPYSIEDGALVLAPKGRGDKARRCVGFLADLTFAARAGHSVQIELEHFDDGAAPQRLVVTYVDVSGTEQEAGDFPYKGTRSWVRPTFLLEGADLSLPVRVHSYAHAPARIRRAGLRRLPGASAPPPMVAAPSKAPRAARPPAGPRKPAAFRPEQWNVMHQAHLKVGKDGLVITSTGNDPHIRGPRIEVQGPADVVLRAKSDGTGEGEIFWMVPGLPHYTGEFRESVPMIHDGDWHEYRVRLHEQRVIQEVRFDPGQGPGTIELASFEVVPVKLPPLPAAPETARVVYFDPRYSAAWNQNVPRLAEQLEKRGFTIVDAGQLAAWMRGRGAGSVCIMALDTFPDTVFESTWPECTARRYLDAGGRIVWAGYIPFAERGLADGRRVWSPAYAHPQYAVGFRPNYSDAPEAPELTDEGRAWGLQIPGPNGNQGADATQVTVVLARLGKFTATSWLKTYNPAVPGSGLLRYRNAGINGSNETDIEELVRVALHGL